MIVSQVETELVAISQRLKSSTVEITARRSGGSGVIWSSDGLVVTNSHVVRDSKVKVKLENGKLVAGWLIARDNRYDLAAIEINIEKNENLSTPILGNDRLLRPGEIVLAMGSPWGFSGALAAGTIHALPRQGEPVKLEPNKINQTSQEPDPPTGAIVADIRLAPGNSGGILANARGEVVGINAAIVNGLALAIPVGRVKDFVGAIAR